MIPHPPSAPETPAVSEASIPWRVEKSTALTESHGSVGVASPVWIVTPSPFICVIIPCVVSPFASRTTSSVRGSSISSAEYPVLTIPATESTENPTFPSAVAFHCRLSPSNETASPEIRSPDRKHKFNFPLMSGSAAALRRSPTHHPTAPSRPPVHAAGIDRINLHGGGPKFRIRQIPDRRPASRDQEKGKNNRPCKLCHQTTLQLPGPFPLNTGRYRFGICKIISAIAVQ